MLRAPGGTWDSQCQLAPGPGETQAFADNPGPWPSLWGGIILADSWNSSHHELKTTGDAHTHLLSRGWLASGDSNCANLTGSSIQRLSPSRFFVESPSTLRTRALHRSERNPSRTAVSSCRCLFNGSGTCISCRQHVAIPAPALWPSCGHVGRNRSSRGVLGRDEPELMSLTWQGDSGMAGSGWEGSWGTQTPLGLAPRVGSIPTFGTSVFNGFPGSRLRDLYSAR